MAKSTMDKFGEICQGIKEGGFSHVLNRVLKGDSGKARNLLFEQKLLLKIAEKYTQDKPWITYFAALKNIVYLRSQGVDTTAFDDFKDKEYAMEVEQYAEALATVAEALLDEETKGYLQELITLQQITPVIVQALEGLRMLVGTSAQARELYINPPKRSLLNELFNPFAKSHADQDVKNVGFSFATSFIKAAAQQLNQRPEDWIRSPEATIQYLTEFVSRRSVLEDTYFPLQ
jgi:hypothetical protein